MEVGSTQEVVMEDSEVVAELRTRLAEQLGQQQYELWFARETQLCLSADALVVVAASAFKRDWLRRNFVAGIQAVCAAVLGDAVRVEFAVDRGLGDKPAGSKEAIEPMDRGESTRIAELSPPAPMASSQLPAMRSTPLPCVRLPLASPIRQEPRLSELVVGASNEYAFHAAQVTAHGLQQASPLTFSGPTGVGKTHLLRAIRAEYRLSHPRVRAVYLTAEQFLSSFVDALRGSGMPSFRQKCRGADLLLIDDIQFLVGKRASLDELQHTVDVLLAEGRQLVLATDKSLSELGALGKDLLSRLASGLVCNVQMPDLVMRCEIVRRFAIELRLDLDAEVIELVANQVPAGARELRGALNRIHATSTAFSQPITRSMVMSAIGDLANQSIRHVRLADVEHAICSVFGVGREDLRSERKSRAIHEPRMLAMWLARRYTRAAWSEIGEFFGRRSHSTVISAHRRVEELIRSRSEFALSQETCSVEEAIRRVEAVLRTA